MATFGVAPSPATAAMGIAPQGSKWSTRLGQCDESTATRDWLLSVFCMPCAAATAKSNTDGSHVCYNLLCWTPIGTASWIRLGYGIEGVCGDDCARAIFCPCCTTRQVLTESQVRGALRGNYGLATREWMAGSLFGCGCTEFFMALLCPCVLTHRTRNMIQGESDRWFDCCCVLPTAMYGLVRNTHGLASECPDFPCLEDIFVPVACFPCALARAQREAIAQKAAGALGGGPIGNAASKIVKAASKYATI